MILLRRAPIGDLGGELGEDLGGSSGVPVDPAELASRASAPAIGEEPEGFEVFLVRRRKGASFMASAFVFPGGGADPDEDARTAAARELFEEAGVLLARDSGRGADTLQIQTQEIAAQADPGRRERGADPGQGGARVVDGLARAVVALDHAVDRAAAVQRAVLRVRAAERAGAELRRYRDGSRRSGVRPRGR